MMDATADKLKAAGVAYSWHAVDGGLVQKAGPLRSELLAESTAMRERKAVDLWIKHFCTNKTEGGTHTKQSKDEQAQTKTG